jgi:hypothetical protein
MSKERVSKFSSRAPLFADPKPVTGTRTVYNFFPNPYFNLNLTYTKDKYHYRYIKDPSTSILNPQNNFLHAFNYSRLCTGAGKV